MQGLSAPAAWARLQELLQQASRQGGAPELQLAVIEGALARDSTLKLPPWLLAAHQVSPWKGQLKNWCLVSSAVSPVPLNGFVPRPTISQQGLDADFLLLPVLCAHQSSAASHSCAQPPLLAVQRTDQADGMVAAGARPADLLRILIGHKALESAAELAVHHLEHWAQVGGCSSCTD